MNSEVTSLINKYPEFREDCQMLIDWMTEVTDSSPELWSGQMIGFGTYHYKYDSGREGDWFLTGFAPRKGKLSIYIINGLQQYSDLLKELGPHSIGKSCLYIKNLSVIDSEVLKTLIAQSVNEMKRRLD